MLKDYLKNFNRRSGKKQTIFLKYKKIGGEGFSLFLKHILNSFYSGGEGIILKLILRYFIVEKKKKMNHNIRE